MMKPLFLLPASLLFGLLPQQATTTQAPASPADAATMVNPIKKTTPESQAKAKKTYGYDCAMCHGAAGDGKGDMVAGMNLTMKDYTNPTTLNGISDGELYSVIKNGKGQMPGEGDRAKPDDIWNLVLLVQSFAKK